MENENKEITLKDFTQKFSFNGKMASYIGVERERFLVDQEGFLMPYADEFLAKIKNPKWTYELSACQVEDRTTPRKTTTAIKNEMQRNDKMGRIIAEKMHLDLQNIEVASPNMPLNVYPDPRYLEIVQHITEERLKAACQVTGTHFHIGMKDLESAIRVANIFAQHIDMLSEMGDHSKMERLRLYKVMAPNYLPPIYESVHHFFEMASEQGFTENPRNCWHLVRISIHGTVELRMFGSTADIDEICYWIGEIKGILTSC